MATLLVLGGLGSTTASWIAYMAAIARERVPPRPRGHVALQIGAIVAALSAVLVHASLGTIVAAVLTTAFAGLFLFLLTQAPVPDAKIRVAVGGPLLPFAALDSDGAAWSSERLRGRKVLLKFFRGAW